jgi:excisionase family DNA binding protein
MKPETQEQDEYLDYAQASRILNLKTATLYSWVYHKRVPHIRLGLRCIRFSRDELMKWIDDCRVNGPSHAANVA